MAPGKCIAFFIFAAGGVYGFLRFWPNGYFTDSQRRERGAGQVQSGECSGAGLNTDAWCCLGAYMPCGTALCFRFFVNDTESKVRDGYWNDGTTEVQLWSPETSHPNVKDFVDFCVGICICENLNDGTQPRSERTCLRCGALSDVGRPRSATVTARAPLLRNMRPEAALGPAAAPVRPPSVLHPRMVRPEHVPLLAEMATSPISREARGATPRNATRPPSTGRHVAMAAKRFQPAIRPGSAGPRSRP